MNLLDTGLVVVRVDDGKSAGVIRERAEVIVVQQPWMVVQRDARHLVELGHRAPRRAQPARRHGVDGDVGALRVSNSRTSGSISAPISAPRPAVPLAMSVVGPRSAAPTGSPTLKKMIALRRPGSVARSSATERKASRSRPRYLSISNRLNRSKGTGTPAGPVMRSGLVENLFAEARSSALSEVNSCPKALFRANTTAALSPGGIESMKASAICLTARPSIATVGVASSSTSTATGRSFNASSERRRARSRDPCGLGGRRDDDVRGPDLGERLQELRPAILEDCEVGASQVVDGQLVLVEDRHIEQHQIRHRFGRWAPGTTAPGMMDPAVGQRPPWREAPRRNKPWRACMPSGTDRRRPPAVASRRRHSTGLAARTRCSMLRAPRARAAWAIIEMEDVCASTNCS